MLPNAKLSFLNISNLKGFECVTNRRLIQNHAKVKSNAIIEYASRVFVLRLSFKHQNLLVKPISHSEAELEEWSFVRQQQKNIIN